MADFRDKNIWWRELHARARGKTLSGVSVSPVPVRVTIDNWFEWLGTHKDECPQGCQTCHDIAQVIKWYQEDELAAQPPLEPIHTLEDDF
jgi:hypothetical protein